MNIAVLVKQVPDTTEIKIDKETGALIRKGIPTITNPDDLTGVELALQLKETYGGNIHAFTMGPSSAKNMLRELYARGIDEATLLSDKAFAGSDTWATSHILASALKNHSFDIVIAGRQAIDGDTAQVGPQVAEFLDIPHVSYVNSVIDYKDGILKVRKNEEHRMLTLNLPTPALITVLDEAAKPRYMNMFDIFKRSHLPLNQLTCDDLDVSLADIGIKGSPTKVKKTFNKSATQKQPKQTLNPEQAAQTILDFIEAKGGQS